MGRFHVGELVERVRHWFPHIEKQYVYRSLHQLVKYHKELTALSGYYYEWSGEQ